MRNITLLIIFCALSINVFAQKKPKIKGDKNVVTVTNKISSGFNAIEIDDDLDIKINQTEENSYTLNADLNLHGIIQFTVHDSVLKIYTTHDISGHKKFEVWLNYIGIEEITLKNKAKIESENTIDSKAFKLTAYHSSKFNLDVKTSGDVDISLHNNVGGKISTRAKKTTILMKDKTDLTASISTEETTLTLTESAQIKLSGDSEDASYIIKNNSELDASKIKNTSVNLNASDNTRAYIYASKNLSLYAKGSASIYLYGEPEIIIEGFREKVQLIKK